ncbi:MAG: hypothetical protein J6Q89_02445 [Clostridia bacterium]|nr:hypothetical protein [Clostridia bacterium]
MISIDTTIMRDLVTASTTANNAITDAMEVLSRITAHNDWACKEKDAINEYTYTNKTKICQLQEHSRSFLTAISGAAAEFDGAETSISDMFSSVESLISNIFSIASGVVADVVDGIPQHTTPPTGFLNNFSDIISDIIKDILPQQSQPSVVDLWGQTAQNFHNAFDSFIVNNVTEPIPICHFPDIDLG